MDFLLFDKYMVSFTITYMEIAFPIYKPTYERKGLFPRHFGVFGASGLSLLLVSWALDLKMLALFYWDVSMDRAVITDIILV